MHTKLSAAAAAFVATAIVAVPAAATPPVTGIGGGVRRANFASRSTARPASAQQRIAITSPNGNNSVFVLKPLTSGPIVRDSGTASYCCITPRYVQRDGQSIEIDNPLRTFVGKRGTFVWRAQIEWVDLDNGDSVGTGTWKIVSGTGAYKQLEGHGRVAVIMGDQGEVGPDAEGLVHLALNPTGGDPDVADSVPPTPHSLGLSSPASAATSSCADPVASAPTGPATVSAASTPDFGRVLVVGSGAYAGCSLYLLTSDQLHALSGAGFACNDNPTVLGPPCDTVLWPALLTDGAPIAGPGVNPTLLGTVTRTDVLAGGVPVRQVTYAGLPLYRFRFDDVPGDSQGADLFDPVTSPTGIWYRVNASRGGPAPARAELQFETVGPETVVAATMNNGFTDVFADAKFPVYTLSSDSGHESACQGQCAQVWPPVLTSKRPEAIPDVDQHALGTIVRPDGTHQVTYDGKPLYLFYKDAYIQGKVGAPAINGAGAQTPWGVFNPILP